MDNELIQQALGDDPRFSQEAQPDEVAPQEDVVPEEPAVADEVPTDKSPEEPQHEEDPELDKPMSEVLGTKAQEAEQEIKDSVPLATFLELKKEMAELRQQNLSKNETSSSLRELADKYDVDQDFLAEFAEGVAAKAKEEVEKKYEPLIKQQADERRLEKQEQMFNAVFEKALASQPEHIAKVVNKDVIKRLAFDDVNGDKSVRQLIKDVYGNVPEQVDSRPSPSFEKASTGTRKDTNIDFNNLSPEDHDTIANDPKLRAEYGDWLVENVM